MNKVSLQDIGLDRYLQSTRSLFGAPVVLVITNARGVVLDATSALSLKVEEAISSVAVRAVEVGTDTIKSYRRSGSSLMLASVIDVHAETICLVMYCESTEVYGYIDADAGLEVVQGVFQSIVDILQLNIELDDMADDLSARYEELNLFYGLDDIVEIKDTRKGHIALKKLSDNCCRYLDVDVVSINVESTHIDVESHSATEVGFRAAWDASNTVLRAAVCEFLHAHYQIRIYNNSDTIDSITHGKFRAKVSTTPIHSANGEILGSIILARQDSGKDFSNSDRRLIRVIAEQASSIVGASFDMMTGLLNREGFMMPVELAIRANTQRARKNCVALFDIDQFRMINDSCGRSAGNELLKSVANQLKQIVPEGSSIARIESDKFAVVVDAGDGDGIAHLINRLQKSFATTGFRWDGKGFDITAGVGVVELQENIFDVENVFALVSVCCEVAKKKGAGGIFFYDPESDQIESANSAIDWLPRIRQALDEDLFQLFGQEIVPLNSPASNKVHFEILLRLQSEDGSYGSPFQMIKAAEKYNIVSRIDHWVLSHALETLQAAKDLYPNIEVSCSVNISGQSVNDEFFGKVASLLRRSPDLTQFLNLEITETAVVSNLSNATRLIESLRQLGVKFSLDDFGTGMSSFGYLRDLPIDYLKIDGSFVRHIVDDRISYAMVESIHNIGHIMGLSTVAEFVENNLITEKLKSIGIDYGQGYALNMPAPILEQLEQFSRSVEEAKVYQLSDGNTHSPLARRR